MAITIQTYNHTAKKLLDLSLYDNRDNFRLVLLSDNVFNAEHTSRDQVTNFDALTFSGNGWSHDGEVLGNLAVHTVTTNDAKIDADDITVSAVGGSIVAKAGVIFVDEGGVGTTLTPLWFIDFGETITATDGADFQVVFHSEGICRALFS